MTLTQVRPTAEMVSRPVDRRKEHHAEFPAHAQRFLERLQTSWPPSAWDEETDTVAYARQVLKLTREQAREVYYRLRERHTFRPSVAEVCAVVDELIDDLAPTGEDAGPLRFEMSPQTAARVLVDPNATAANRAKALKVLPNLQLASTGEGVGRSRSREILNELRRRSGMPERASQAPTAKYAPEAK